MTKILLIFVLFCKIKYDKARKKKFVIFSFFYYITLIHLTLKRLGRGGWRMAGGGGVNFLKIVSSKQRVKPWFFVTLKTIMRYIFPENFIEIPQVVQKLLEFRPSPPGKNTFKKSSLIRVNSVFKMGVF